MKLPSFKRLNKNDYPPEFRELVERLSVSLNIGIETLYQLANNQITLKDNIADVVKDITVTVDNTGNPTSEPSIALSSAVKTALGTQVILAQNQTNSTVYPTGGIFLSFTQNGTNIIINNITGLPAGQQFLLRVVVYA